MYWKIKGYFPINICADAEEEQTRLIRVWAFGEKYGIKDLQDLAMLELLRVLKNNYTNLDIAKEAVFIAGPSSRLGMVMVEALLAYIRDVSYDEAPLSKFDRVDGFTAARMFADDRLDSGRHCSGSRLNDTEDWQRCMVAGGPKEHWVHEWAEAK